MEPVHVRLVTDPNDPALRAFGKVQSAVYFEPEALIPGEWFGRLIEMRSGSRENFVLLAERDGEVLGGTIFHYLAEPDSGFSSFMGVSQKARGQGIARRLHEARWQTLEKASNNTIGGVFIDVVNPTRMSAHELARERRVGSDPYVRRRIFNKLGFRQVGIRYEQPVGGPGGGPVTKLDLLFYSPAMPKTVPTALVANTMRAYWQAWLGDERSSFYAHELRDRANGQEHLELVSPEV